MAVARVCLQKPNTREELMLAGDRSTKPACLGKTIIILGLMMKACVYLTAFCLMDEADSVRQREVGQNDEGPSHLCSEVLDEYFLRCINS